MPLARVALLLVPVTLFEMMLAIGLGVSLADLAAVLKNARLVARVALANYFAVPAIAVALLVSLHARPMVAAGVLHAAVCPGAPYAPPLTRLARGSVPVSVGLMVILAASSALLAPIFLGVLLPVLVRGTDFSLDVPKIIQTLLFTQLLPLAVGLIVRRAWPAVSDKLTKPANLLSGVLNFAMFTLIITLQYRTLTDIRLKGFVGMCLLVGLCLLPGWILGGPPPGSRRAVTFTTATRNVGVALLIATTSFRGTAAVSTVVIYAIFQTIGLGLVAIFWGRFVSASPARE